MGVVYGFAGIVNNAKHFSLEPKLPSAWNSIKFKLRLHGNECLFTIYQDEVQIELMSGKGIEVYVYNKRVKVEPENSKMVCEY